MEKKFLDKVEKTLLAQKKEIISSLLSDKAEFNEIADGLEHSKDAVDYASDDMDRNLLEVLGSTELKRLRSIDSAISRIKQGKYGNCIKCGQTIPKSRLEAMPSALMCIECKSAEERKNR
ncbi:MAG: TraR/DksA C4-type zinc finger protein [Spirochaetaceae bacterium]|jgi:RNA polymerase-binding protein DksA|nr:TraR/DksA C4-type zinc finger protein [Spirochaetaceae bacterium]